MPTDSSILLPSSIQIVVGGAFVVLTVASLTLKALAMWRAARRGEKGWFIALLVINTMGLLEMYYLFVIAKNSDKTQNMQPPAPTSPVVAAPAVPVATTPPPGSMNQSNQ